MVNSSQGQLVISCKFVAGVKCGAGRD